MANNTIPLYKKVATYQLYLLLLKQIADFFTSLGHITTQGFETFKYILKCDVDRRELFRQCARFGVSSLPITISIVSMTAIIVSMQVAGEMVKQGGGNYVGMLVAILIIREVGVIMSGFAIISMIGSSITSEIATMRVTEQIDAIKSLKVDPIKYLFVPRVMSGLLMMAPVVIIASLFGVLGGGIAANVAGGLNYKAYFDSVWFGLYMKDIGVCLMKAICFGGIIALISCSCGYYAKGGAKGVGIATTKAVVWAFVAIVICDMLFAIGFFF